MSSSSCRSCSSLCSLVCFSIYKSCFIVSTIPLIRSRTCSSDASRALRSAVTVLVIASHSSTTLLTIWASYSCLSWDSALLQSCNFGKSVSSSLSNIVTLSFLSLNCLKISFCKTEDLSSMKATSCFSVSLRFYSSFSNLQLTISSSCLISSIRMSLSCSLNSLSSWMYS